MVQYPHFIVGRVRNHHRKIVIGLCVKFGQGFIAQIAIPGIEFFYNGWQAGFTYDINISDFNVATSKKGGPEISLRYIFRKVRPLPIFKICPLI